MEITFLMIFYYGKGFELNFRIKITFVFLIWIFLDCIVFIIFYLVYLLDQVVFRCSNVPLQIEKRDRALHLDVFEQCHWNRTTAVSICEESHWRLTHPTKM